MLSNEGESAKMRQRHGKMSWHKREKEQQTKNIKRGRGRERGDGVHRNLFASTVAFEVVR